MKFHYLLIGLLAFTTACNSGKKRENTADSPVITVSIMPQKTFVEKIAGTDFDIQVLVPHGASPETYTLLPSQLKDITRSIVWFQLGHLGFEHAWESRVADINRQIAMVNLSDGLDLIAGEVMQHGDHVHLEGVDPHIWMSPALVKQASEKIAAKLGEINPEKRELYQTNYKRFAEEIDALDQEIRAALAPYRGRSVVTFHPSISYFARDYGLNLLSLEADGKEPAPQHMAGVIAQARKEQIKAIYIQSEFDQENARVFAEEIKGKVVEIKPLSENWAENLTTMTQLFIENF